MPHQSHKTNCSAEEPHKEASEAIDAHRQTKQTQAL